MATLSERRSNAPSHLGALPSFQLETPNRTRYHLRSLPSTDSLASVATMQSRTTLPLYEALEDDGNPDVITTSVEIDPENESDAEDMITPPAVLLTPSKAVEKKSLGLSKLFQRAFSQPLHSPGVRMTQAPRILKSRTKDIRDGFPLGLPTSHGAPIAPAEEDEWLQMMARVNILLAAGHFAQVQKIFDSEERLRDRVIFTKLSYAKAQGAEFLETPKAVNSAFDIQGFPPVHDLLPITESMQLSPAPEDLDDGASLRSASVSERRGSAASTCSSATSTRSRSSFGSRLRSKFERKEEWCLLFDN